MMVLHQSFMSPGVSQNRRTALAISSRRVLASPYKTPRHPVLHAGSARHGDSVEIFKPRLFQREVDARQDPSLLTPRGQWFKLAEVLLAAITSEGELPEQAVIKIRYPEAPPLDKIKKKLVEMEQMAKTNSLKMMIARRMGFPSKVPPMLFDHDTQSITFSVNITQAEIPELQKFANFLIKNHQYMDASY